MADFKDSYGEWSIVTGASAGIGREFALQIAAKHINIVLVARRGEPLAELASELECKFNIKCRVISLDLTDAKAIEQLILKTSDLEIGLLVNNAGIYEGGAFHSKSIESIQNLINLNIVALTRLTYFFGQRMLKMGRGGIILMASNSAYQPIPYLADYAASKAFVLSLGESLFIELASEGVDVLVLAPGPTKTPGMEHLVGLDINKVPMHYMSAKACVSQGLSALGSQPSLVVGGLNKLLVFINQRLLGRRFMLSNTAKTMRKALS